MRSREYAENMQYSAVQRIFEYIYPKQFNLMRASDRISRAPQNLFCVCVCVCRKDRWPDDGHIYNTYIGITTKMLVRFSSGPIYTRNLAMSSAHTCGYVVLYILGYNCIDCFYNVMETIFKFKDRSHIVNWICCSLLQLLASDQWCVNYHNFASDPNLLN